MTPLVARMSDGRLDGSTDLDGADLDALYVVRKYVSR